MSITLRPLRAEDRPLIQQVLRQTEHFSEMEIEIALELVDAVINKTDLSYQFIVAEKPGGHFAGYGCWGKTPLTLATYDIYWIAVSPVYQGQGVGSQLLHYMETQIMKDQGRLIIVETSSSEVYQDTRAFYLKRGYILESQIKDFYKPEDDKVVYSKRFRPFG
jgi:ribosomal protein S18 acetylase RimI-like enzyme